MDEVASVGRNQCVRPFATRDHSFILPSIIQGVTPIKVFQCVRHDETARVLALQTTCVVAPDDKGSGDAMHQMPGHDHRSSAEVETVAGAVIVDMCAMPSPAIITTTNDVDQF
jgi:hypothetical protein